MEKLLKMEFFDENVVKIMDSSSLLMDYCKKKTEIYYNPCNQLKSIFVFKVIDCIFFV